MIKRVLFSLAIFGYVSFAFGSAPASSSTLGDESSNELQEKVAASATDVSSVSNAGNKSSPNGESDTSFFIDSEKSQDADSVRPKKYDYTMISVSTSIEALFFESGKREKSEKEGLSRKQGLSHKQWVEAFRALKPRVYFLIGQSNGIATTLPEGLIDEIASLAMTLSRPEIFSNLCDLFKNKSEKTDNGKQEISEIAEILSKFFVLCSRAALQLKDEPFREILSRDLEDLSKMDIEKCLKQLKIRELDLIHSGLGAEYYNPFICFGEAVGFRVQRSSEAEESSETTINNKELYSTNFTETEESSETIIREKSSDFKL